MCFRTTDKNDRVMIFMDLANIEYGLKNNEGLENCLIDHEGLATILIDGRKVAGAMVFDTVSRFKNDRSEEEYLSDVGYKIVKGHMEDGKQKEVDVTLAVEMLMHAVNDHYDVAILMSGDRDFIPVISAVQALGKKVEVVAYSDSTSREVVSVSDEFIRMEKLPVIEYHAPDNTVHPDSETADDFVDVTGIIAEAAECQGAE
jgi:uncharacterized LabA/DUF88 family protein